MNTSLIKIVSAVLIVIITIPSCYKLWKGTLSQNFTTWALWFMLDGICAASVFVHQGNFILPAVYSVSCLLVALFCLKAKPTWTQKDSIIWGLVMLCVAVWILSGPYWAAIISTIAVLIAGWPQFMDCWNHPEKQWPLRWWVSSAAAIMSAVAGSEWSVEQRLFPVSIAIYTGMCGIACLQKSKPITYW